MNQFNIEDFDVETEIDSDNENVVKDKNDGHDSMVKEVSKKIGGKKRGDDRQPQWKSDRAEVRTDIDEHGISKNKKSKLDVEELLDVDDEKAKILRKKLRQSLRKKKALYDSLSNPITERIHREINYKDLKESVKKYDEPVKQLRNADQVVFPAEDRQLTVDTSAQKKFLQPGTSTDSETVGKLVSRIEKEIAENLADSGDVNDGSHETYHSFLNQNELELLRTLDMEEARKLHKEMQRLRVLISYQEARYRRLRKIKSKNYHRLKKKDRLKKAEEEFYDLVAKDAEKAYEKMEEMDRLRAHERATLKHSNTGKWAKRQLLRSKFKQTRDNLDEQLKTHNLLMLKQSNSLSPMELWKQNDEQSFSERYSTLLELPLHKNKQLNSYNPWSSKLIQESSNATFTITEQQFSSVKDKDKDEGTVKDDRIGKVERWIATLSTKDSARKINLEKSFTDKNIEVINLDDDDNDDEFNDNIDLAKQSKQLQQVFGDDNVVEDFLKIEQQSSLKKKSSDKYPKWPTMKWTGHGINVKMNSKKPKTSKPMIDKAIFIDPKKQSKTAAAVQQKLMIDKACQAIFIDPDKQLQTAAKYQGHLTVKQSGQLIRPHGSIWNPQTLARTFSEPTVITRPGQVIEPMQSLRANSDQPVNLSIQKPSSKIQKQQKKRRPLSKM